MTQLTPYAGIGSRKTPTNILQLIHVLAAKLHDDGYILRTGHAAGADQAFELGARDMAEVYLPWPDYNVETPIKGIPMPEPSWQAMQMAERYHPAWDHVSPGAAKLHARNSHIVMGENLDDPVGLVVAWYDPRENSGTMQAIRIADDQDIEIRNLFFAQTATAACEYCGLDASEFVL